MNNSRFQIILLFILLVLAQVFFFDKLYLYDYINPMIYIVFIMVYPFQYSKGTFYIISFLLGLILDIFHGTGGMHASASLTIAALRYPLITLLIGKDTETTDVEISSTRNYIMIIYLLVLVLIHHLVLFYLDFFKISALGIVLLSTVKTGFFTFIISFLGVKFFQQIKK